MQTLEQVRASLAKWYDALDEIAGGKSVSMNGRSWTGADSAEIRQTIVFLERRELSLQNVAAGRSGFGASVARFK